jgi:hypothetical protein
MELEGRHHLKGMSVAARHRTLLVMPSSWCVPQSPTRMLSMPMSPA